MQHHISHMFDQLSLRQLGAAGMAALTFALAGCSDPTDNISTAVYDAMNVKPVGSYTLLPVMKEKDGTSTPTGKFNIVLKRGETINTNAVNPEGKSGTMACSALSVIPARLNQIGDLELRYSDSLGRCSSNSYKTIKLIGDKADIPADSGTRSRCSSDNDQLVQYTTNYCRFTPAPAGP